MLWETIKSVSEQYLQLICLLNDGFVLKRLERCFILPVSL